MTKLVFSEKKAQDRLRIHHRRFMKIPLMKLLQVNTRERRRNDERGKEGGWAEGREIKEDRGKIGGSGGQGRGGGWLEGRSEKRERL